MIQVSCPSCSKAFRVKDSAAGKRFECGECGEVITVPEAKPKAGGSSRRSAGGKSSAGTSSARRQAGSAAPVSKKKPQPQYDDDLEFEDEGGDDEYEDDYAEDSYDDGGYDDYEDDYDEPAPKKRSKSSRSGGSKSKPKSSKAKAKPAKKKKKSGGGGGGLAVGLNINRLNIIITVVGVMAIVLGVRETILAGKADAEPTQMSVQELIANGVGDNIHLTLTGVACSDEFVYSASERAGRVGNYETCYIPAAAAGGDGALKLIIKTTEAKNDGDVQAISNRSSHTGLIVNSIESLSGEEEQLLGSISGVDTAAVYIFHESRTPTGAGMLILYFAGGLVLLAGGLFWIFLVH